MDPEQLDRLRHTGEIDSNPNYKPEELQTIADLCREEYALDLFSSTVQLRRLITGEVKPTCHVQGMAYNYAKYASALIKTFVDRRLKLQNEGVLCNPVVPIDGRNKMPSRDVHPAPLPDPVSGKFTLVEHDPHSAHYDQFPHMVLLVGAAGPRVYTVMPMPAELSNLEDTAFELAKIFSVYARINLCLVLSPEKCVYIRKDATYKRSNQRPTGGALAHRSITGPHLYGLHLDPLQAVLRDRPDAFQWHDAFETNSELYTGREYNHVEAVVDLSDEIINRVKDEITRTLAEFRPILERVWGGNTERLRENTAAWASALGISNTVRVIGSEDLAQVSANPIPGSEFLASALYRSLGGVLDVMDYDLKRAGLLDLVNTELAPAYTASHYGYLNLLAQSARLAGPADNDTLWKRILGQVYPAAVCSPVTLLRLEVWRRIQPLYREHIPSVDTTLGTYAQAQALLSSLPLLMKVNEQGPVWIWQGVDDICVMPAVVVRFDEEGDPHCDDGPAIIAPDGTEQFWNHGEESGDQDED